MRNSEKGFAFRTVSFRSGREGNIGVEFGMYGSGSCKSTLAAVAMPLHGVIEVACGCGHFRSALGSALVVRLLAIEALYIIYKERETLRLQGVVGVAPWLSISRM